MPLYFRWRLLYPSGTEEGKDESAIRKAVNRALKKIKRNFLDRPNWCPPVAIVEGQTIGSRKDGAENEAHIKIGIGKPPVPGIVGYRKVTMRRGFTPPAW